MTRLSPPGTAFQRRVWRALQSVPFGRTVSYAELAVRAGFPRRYARAVGQAVARNPIAIIIPCHRVVPSHGKSIGEYAWGRAMKKRLLDYEKELKDGHP